MKSTEFQRDRSQTRTLGGIPQAGWNRPPAQPWPNAQCRASGRGQPRIVSELEKFSSRHPTEGPSGNRKPVERMPRYIGDGFSKEESSRARSTPTRSNACGSNSTSAATSPHRLDHGHVARIALEWTTPTVHFLPYCRSTASAMRSRSRTRFARRGLRRLPTAIPDVMDQEVESLQDDRPERTTEVDRQPVAVGQKHPKASWTPMSRRTTYVTSPVRTSRAESGSETSHETACEGVTRRGHPRTRPDRGECRIPPLFQRKSRS